MKNAPVVLAVLCLLAVPSVLQAAEKPEGTEAWKVVSYYFDGKDLGPVLMESHPCLKVDNDKGSETRYECLQPVSGNVAKGTYVSAWTKWLVPKGGEYEDVCQRGSLGFNRCQSTSPPDSSIWHTTDNPPTAYYRSDYRPISGDWQGHCNPNIV